MTIHVYLSTSCLHSQHEHCRSDVGPHGRKVPGQCKWCPAMCVCPCHQEVTDDEADG